MIGSRSTSLEFQGSNPCGQRFYTPIAYFISCFKNINTYVIITFILKKKLRGYVLHIISFLFYHVTFHSLRYGCTAGRKQVWKNIVIFVFLHRSLHEYFCDGIFSSTTGTTTTRFNSTTNKGESWTALIKTSLP